MQYSDPPKAKSPLPWILGCLGGCFLIGLIALVGVFAMISLKGAKTNGPTNPPGGSGPGGPGPGQNGPDGPGANNPGTTQPTAGGTGITSTDGRVQITVPDGWSTQTGLNAAAIIQAANTTQGCYVLVMSQEKSDPNVQNANLDQYSDTLRGQMSKTMTSPQVGQSQQVTISGFQGNQADITGTMVNTATNQTIPLAYVHTVIDTPQRYYQVLTWTLQSSIDQNRAALVQVTNSFQATANGP